MAASIVVEFEVLPDESGAVDRSAQQVCAELKRQLGDPSSQLRNGEFGRFAASASLSAPGLPDATPAGGDFGGGFGETLRPTDEGMFGSGSGHRGGGGGTARAAAAGATLPFESAHAHRAAERSGTALESSRAPVYGGPSEWAGLSNADLVDRISQLEGQLKRTAAGPPSSGGLRQELPPSSTIRSQRGGAEGLDEKCYHLQQKLEAMEQELREAHEAARMHRQRYEQCEHKLKDREQLLVHAKEMWMKENVRASKLADALTTAEDKIADQEKRLGEAMARYSDAQSEVKALQHVIGADTNGDHLSWEKKNGRVPATAGELSMPGTRGFGSSSSFDGGGLGREPYGTARTLSPSSYPGALDDGRPLPITPLDGETNADRFRRLCLVNDAVLYEDALIQIGIKAEYNGREGQLDVYFGNKCGAPLHAFTVQYFVKEESALRLSASPISQQLPADKQVIQRITALLQEPFIEPPILRMQFLLPDTSPRTCQLKLPVVLTKFMVGREMGPQDYFQKWRQQHFVLNEATSIVHLASRYRGSLVHIARSIVFGGGLRMHHGVDSNPDNFVLVGQLCDSGRAGGDFEAERSHGAFGGGPDRENGLSLVRVEVGSGRFVGKARVVVRSSDHVVARALCDGIVAQLAEANAPQSDGKVAR